MPQRSSYITSKQECPLVAIGGSAGSLDALLQFFQVLPKDCGMAFIIVVHLAPKVESLLPELLRRRCALKVTHARNNQRIAANRVYVIPPGSILTRRANRLQLKPLDPATGRVAVIDVLFDSIAAPDHGPIAGILLSGADSDGAAGLQQIKRAGGLVLAQDPAEAAQETMPRAAIDSGCADAVLRAADMPARLLSHFGIAAVLRQPPPLQLIEAKQAIKMTARESDLVQKAVQCLRLRTGRDFSGFRQTMVLRHIHRRMELMGKAKLPEYLRFVDTDPVEPEALIRELQVPVTGFFRDPEAFNALARYLPGLFEGKGEADFVRAWVPACATGEEVYSIAMLLLEHARTLEHPPGIQVFGCDMASAAIEKARAGLYRAEVAEPLGSERLEQFFHAEADGYRVRRALRQAVLFAEHDVVRDPAFSRMDLVSCRNLLIYLNPDGQKRMIEVFDFALAPQGLLFLGLAEGLFELSTAFDPLDARYCIYRRCAGQKDRLPVSAEGDPLLRSMNAELSAVNSLLNTKLSELERTNSDLNNLMNGAAIPMVFLNRELRIMSYTPGAQDLFRLIPSDVGRPLSDLHNSLEYPELTADAGFILNGGDPVERDVREQSGKWFFARMLPYHTPQSHIAGVVLTFVDITERKRAEEALHESEEKYRTLFGSLDAVQRACAETALKEIF